jgi:hypothetical protein
MAEEMKTFDDLKSELQEEKKDDIIDVEADEIEDETVDDDMPTLIIKKSDIEKKDEEKKQAEKDKIGGGVILDKKVLPDARDAQRVRKGIDVGNAMSKDSMESVTANFSDMDRMIDEQRKIAAERISKGDAPTKEISDPYAPKEVQDANRKIHEQDAVKENETAEAKPAGDGTLTGNEDVTILIDRAGLGKFEFTPEEKERIEHSKRIRIVEVEDKALKNLKIKKTVDGKDKFHILKRNFDKSLSPVIALASGYTCKMKNIAASEAIRMYQGPGEDTANSILDKWSVIYDKITDVSRGPFDDFEDFCKHTAFMDYDAFLYGMICSSYPEDDTIPFNCPKDKGGCGKDFEFAYNNKQMIRQDLIKPETKQIMANIINNAAYVDKAREFADASPVNNFERFLLDKESGIIIEIFIPSVYEMVERVFRKMDSNKDLSARENRPNILLAQGIKNIYIPDYESMTDDMDISDVDYIDVSGIEAIIEALKNLNEMQINLIAKKLNQMTEFYSLTFGFPSITCPHCKHDWGRYDMELDNILFRRVQQRVTTEIV